MNHLLRAVGAVVLLGAASFAGPAFPAPAPATPGESGLEEIVVTAEKRNSTVQETAISMTAVSGELLEKQGTTTVEDLIGKIPGISERTAGPGQTEYEMRGLTSSGGSTATVGFYLDETPLSASAVALNGRTVIDPDLFDLNHAEVLRGPQGTLYGAGSMGGTIKLATNQPKLGAFEGATSVSASQTDGGSTNGGGNLMLNIPLGDKAAFRFVTSDKYISGWIDRKVVGYPDAASPSGYQFPFPTNYYLNGTVPGCGNYFCTRGNVQDATVLQDITGSNLERFESARGILLVEPVDGLAITGTLMWQKIDADGYNTYQDPPGVSGYSIYQPYDQPEPYYDTFKLASLKVAFDAGFADLTSATAYWKREVRQSQDSAEPLQNIFNLTQFIQNLYVEDDPTTQVSEELRLSSKGTGALQWVGGLFITDLHSGYVTYNQNPGFATAQTCAQSGVSGGSCVAQGYGTVNINTPLPGLTAQQSNPNGIIFNDNNPNVTKQQAVFGEASYKFTDEWKLTAGLRYFKFTVANISNQAGVGTGTGNETAQTGSASGKGSGVLPKVNLSYQPTPDLNLYGTISKGSRPGGVNLPIPLLTLAQHEANPNAYDCGPGTAEPNVPGPGQPAYYQPDNIWSVELGEKARFDDRRITVNADIFYVKWTNIQEVIALSCGYPIDQNAGNAKTYGPELEVSAIIAQGLTADFTGAYTQAYISDPNSLALAAAITPGTRIFSVPRYTGSLAFNYETMLTPELHGTAHLADAYVGPVFDTAYHKETLSPYALVDGRVGVGKGPWTAFLFGTNLTDKHAGLTINNTTFAWQQPTITRFSTNQPRTIGLEFQTKF